MELLGGAATVFLVWYGSRQIREGQLTEGEFLLFVVAALMMYTPIKKLSRVNASLQQAMAASERIFEVLDTHSEVRERPNAVVLQGLRHSIEFQHVAFLYDDRPSKPILRDVSFRVGAGEMVAIVGLSGAGKTTLVNLLPRFYDVTAGAIRIDGVDIRDLTLASLRTQIGMVTQETVLFDESIASNIAYGSAGVSREEIEQAARAAHAHEFIAGLPDRYNTRIGERGQTLSGGQRQRIAIARTLLRDPAVLVLDEPTTGLDAESEQQVVAGLERLMQGRTAILITHSPRLARLADRTVALTGERAAKRLPLPRDRKLPALPTLLDAEAMAPRLAATLNGGPELTDVRVRYLRYKPGTNIVVHYDVGFEGGSRHDAIAMTASGRSLARRAAKPENQALAALVHGRVPARESLSYDDELGALLQWFPLDLSLPALAQPRSVIRDELEAAGARVDGGWPEPNVLAYKARRRAVLHSGGDVLKFYAKRDEFHGAVRGLVASARLRGVRCPEPVGVLPARRVTVQRFLPGAQPQPHEAARAAGALLADLHASELGPLLPTVPPSAQLEAAGATVGLIAALSDTLGRRALTLLERLSRDVPAALPLVPSHGDFNSRQLLACGDGLALVDFDALCRAPAALDLATYAAYVVLGADDALERAQGVLSDLLEGYGGRPPALPWYLATCILRRAARPFRYLEPDWPDRVGGMLAAAEAVS
jgi:ABC-type glutathione transport system ATPase component